MPSALQALESELADVEAKLRPQTELEEQKRRLEAAIAALQGRGPQDGRVLVNHRVKLDDQAIVNYLRKAQIEQSAVDIKEGIGYSGSSQTLSLALKRLSEEGRIKRTGERRGTRYQIP